MTQNDDNRDNQQPEAVQKDAPTRQDKTIDMDGLDIPETDTDNLEEDLELGADLMDEEGGFPGMDENMFGQVQEMMAKLQQADELEKENADLKGRLARLAADFESQRRRLQGEVDAAQGQGIAKAAESLMPVYDDLDRAVSMGVGDPTKLIPGMQAVQATMLRVFGGLGLEVTGREGETFDPQWHEALQVVPGDADDVIVQVYQLGFRMGDRLVRPARVVVSKQG
ncbi:nucleotide exchange factor GrpE [Deinococcus oregonensis]|uniref:Protein GrpE n=1 Tax=Deinococcus oregonensis TaxID=1805970 RepID=A0ABV6AT57_9DEIO